MDINPSTTATNSRKNGFIGPKGQINTLDVDGKKSTTRGGALGVDALIR